MLREFDEGFDHDGKGPLADSLAAVMHAATEARKKGREGQERPENSTTHLTTENNQIQKSL
jgi:hypothetical protein